MDPRIPEGIQTLLHNYIRSVDQALPNRMIGFYLEGSIALDGFNPRLSDIDFVTVLAGPASQNDYNALLKIHRLLEQRYPAWHLSGMYFQPGNLGCLEQTSQPFLQYQDGKLKWSSHFKLSSVTWWILKHHGIAVYGPPPEALDIPVDMDHLIEVQRQNLNSYWASWTKHPIRILGLLSDWGIQWTVLGVLRQYYTLREHDIVSKVKAGEYALPRLPERWHALIREAIALREDPDKVVYQSRVRRAVDAYRFLRYVIQACNRYLADEG